MASYTIYKIGGPARFFVEVKNAAEIEEALKWAARIGVPFFLLGAGSNILVSDKGFDGLVIRVMGGEVKIEGEYLTADAGAMMAKAVLESSKAELTGFEWGIGVPGTMGGSVRGNAGCFGGEMGQVVASVRLLEFPISNFQFSNKSQISNSKITTRELTNQECRFGYRDSIFKKHPEWVIVSATLKLQKGNREEIKAKIAAITKERSEKQDLGTKTCGCIFKNVPWARVGVNGSSTPVDTGDELLQNKKEFIARFPELAQFKDQPNIPASFLIDQAGLKGRRVGKVFISPKHANFFVNSSPTKSLAGDKGGASAGDVVTLAGIAKDIVRRKYGIVLEEEIQRVGF